MKRTTAALFLVTACAVAVFVVSRDTLVSLVETSSLVAAVFRESITPDLLRAHYRAGTSRVLIVPGHDNRSWGTEFGGLREADLTLTLGYHLYNFFASDPAFAAYIMRAPDGNIAPWFLEFSAANADEISAFRTQSKLKTAYYKQVGELAERRVVRHNPAADNVSRTLYAVNKWANDNGADIVLHLHFNDYPRRRPWVAGEHTGFSIYIPEAQLPNARGSRMLAESVRVRLLRLFAPSTLPLEKDTIIEDQDLIAVGSNASRDGASLVIEYGYIYEPYLHDASVRSAVLREIAYQTYRAVKEALGGTGDVRALAETTLLPYRFSRQLGRGARGEDVLALQAALRKEGFYPPPDSAASDCPVSGYFGGCTERAVRAFERAHGIPASSSGAGAATIDMLNALYAPAPVLVQ